MEAGDGGRRGFGTALAWNLKGVRGSRRRYTPTPVLAVLAAAAFATVAATAVAAPRTGSSARASTTHPAHAPALARTNRTVVSAALRRAESLTSVPADLRPPLSDTSDIEVLASGGSCPTGYHWPHLGIDAYHFGACTYGDPRGRDLMVVFGDSQAGMWLTALEPIASRLGWRLKAFFLPGCPAAQLTFWNRATGKPDHACDAFRAAAVAAIRGLHPRLTVVASASLYEPISPTRSATARLWRFGMVRTLASLRESGNRLVVMGDLPVLARDPSCLASHRHDVRFCMTRRSLATAGLLAGADRSAASLEHALYVPVVPWVCARMCVPVVGSMRVYNDRYQLSATYVHYLSGALEQALRFGPAAARHGGSATLLGSHRHGPGRRATTARRGG